MSELIDKLKAKQMQVQDLRDSTDPSKADKYIAGEYTPTALQQKAMMNTVAGVSQRETYTPIATATNTAKNAAAAAAAASARLAQNIAANTVKNSSAQNKATDKVVIEQSARDVYGTQTNPISAEYTPPQTGYTSPALTGYQSTFSAPAQYAMNKNTVASAKSAVDKAREAVNGISAQIAEAEKNVAEAKTQKERETAQRTLDSLSGLKKSADGQFTEAVSNYYTKAKEYGIETDGSISILEKLIASDPGQNYSDYFGLDIFSIDNAVNDYANKVEKGTFTEEDRKAVGGLLETLYKKSGEYGIGDFAGEYIKELQEIAKPENVKKETPGFKDRIALSANSFLSGFVNGVSFVGSLPVKLATDLASLKVETTPLAGDDGAGVTFDKVGRPTITITSKAAETSAKIAQLVENGEINPVTDEHNPLILSEYGLTQKDLKLYNDIHIADNFNRAVMKQFEGLDTTGTVDRMLQSTFYSAGNMLGNMLVSYMVVGGITGSFSGINEGVNASNEAVASFYNSSAGKLLSSLSVTNPNLASMAASSLSSQLIQNSDAGHDLKTAYANALGNAWKEVMTENIFGTSWFGGGSLDFLKDTAVTAVKRKFSNTAGVIFGQVLDMLGEGAEEMIGSPVEALINGVTTDKGKKIDELISFGQIAEEGLSGALVSVIMLPLGACSVISELRSGNEVTSSEAISLINATIDTMDANYRPKYLSPFASEEQIENKIAEIRTNTYNMQVTALTDAMYGNGANVFSDEGYANQLRTASSVGNMTDEEIAYKLAQTNLLLAVAKEANDTVAVEREQTLASIYEEAAKSRTDAAKTANDLFAEINEAMETLEAMAENEDNTQTDNGEPIPLTLRAVEDVNETPAETVTETVAEPRQTVAEEAESPVSNLAAEETNTPSAANDTIATASQNRTDVVDKVIAEIENNARPRNLYDTADEYDEAANRLDEMGKTESAKTLRNAAELYRQAGDDPTGTLETLKNIKESRNNESKTEQSGQNRTAENQNAEARETALSDRDESRGDRVTVRERIARLLGQPVDERTRKQLKRDRIARTEAALKGTPSTAKAENIANGTADNKIYRYTPTDTDMDKDLLNAISYAKKLGIKDVRCYVGGISVRSGAESGYSVADGVFDPKTGILSLRVDTEALYPWQTILHEVSHHLLAENTEALDRFLESAKESPEWSDIYAAYEDYYNGVTNDFEGMTAEEKDDYICEEIFCDAYAEVDHYGVKATTFSDLTASMLDETETETAPAVEAEPQTEETETERNKAPPEEEPKNVLPKVEEEEKKPAKKKSVPKYSIGEIVGNSGKHYGQGVILDSTLLTNLTDQERIGMVKLRVEELGGQVFTAYDEQGKPHNIKIAEKGRRFHSEAGKNPLATNHLRGYLKNKTKQEAIVLSNELVQTARNFYEEDATHPHDWLDNNGKNPWEKWTVILQDKEKTVWEATLRVANTEYGEKILYEIYPINEKEAVRKSNTSSQSSEAVRKSNTSSKSDNITNAKKSQEENQNSSEKSSKSALSDNSPVSQEISSADTSLNQIPALFTDKRVSFGDVNIDIGGGRFDKATNFLAEQGTRNMVFDPYNRSEEHNAEVFGYLQSGNKADTATNANVLNVIREDAARDNVILEMAKAIKEDGTAYFMVYEGNGTGEGKQTSKGWQNNRKTASYKPEIEKYFNDVTVSGKLITAKNPKANLPKAIWELSPGNAVRYALSDNNKIIYLVDQLTAGTDLETALNEANIDHGRKGKPISKFRTNTLKVSNFYDAVEKNMEGLREEDYTYDPITEKRSIEQARRRLENGVDSVVTELNSSEEWGGYDLDAAMGVLWVYRQEARMTGDYRKVNEWSHMIQQKATRNGQFIQAFAKYTRTPQGIAAKAAKDIKESLGIKNKVDQDKADRISKQVRNQITGAREDTAHQAKNDPQKIIDKITRQNEDAMNVIREIYSYFRLDNDESHGIPVKDWTIKTGDQLADSISRRFTPKQSREKTTMQIVLSDLMKYAEDTALPARESTGETRTAIDRVRDFMANRDQYAEAWNEARRVLRAQYSQDQEKLDALETFLNSSISFNAETGRIDRTMLDAILLSSDTLGIDKDKIIKLSSVGLNDSTVERIASRFVSEVGVTGSDAKMLRDAVTRHINGIISDNYARYETAESRMIAKAQKELGSKISDILAETKADKAAFAKAISDYLIEDLGVSGMDAAIASDHITKAVFDEIAERCDARLRQMFKEKSSEIKEKKKVDKLLELIRLGGLTNENVHDAVIDALGLTKIPIQKQNEVINEMMRIANTLDDIGNGNVDALRSLIIEASEFRKIKVGRMTENLLNKETDVNFLYNTALGQLHSIASDYVPRTIGEKINTVVTLNHLLNFRTGNTNVTSNQATDIVATFANNMSLLPDWIMSQLTGVRGVGFEKSWFSKRKRAGAIEGARRNAILTRLDIADEVDTSSKYGTKGRRTFSRANGNWFERNVLARGEELLGYELNTTDEFHKGSVRGEVLDSLQKYVDLGQFTAEEAEELAHEEALKRSFQDDTFFGAAMSIMKKFLNIFGVGDTGKGVGPLGLWGKHTIGVGDFVVKYVQVPGALIHRAMEFTPLGYIKAAYNIGRLAYARKTGNVKDGQTSLKLQRRAALAIGDATTGTGLIILFTLLAKLGLLTVQDDDQDKNKTALESARGKTGAQLNLSAIDRLLKGEDATEQSGDIKIALDRLEPLDSLMNIAGLINRDVDWSNDTIDKILKNAGEDTLNGIWLALKNTSAMQTISDMYNAAYYSDNKGWGLVGDIAIELASSTATSAIPALVRQTAQATDTVYREQYATQNTFEQILASVINTIPGLRQKLLNPKLDSFGREKQYQSPVINALNTYLLPGNISVNSFEDVDNIVGRLYDETENAGVYHDRTAPYTLRVGDEKYTLTGEERQEYQRESGTLAAALITAVAEQEWFDKSDSVTQAEVVSFINKYSEFAAEKSWAIGRGIEYGNQTYNALYGLEGEDLLNGIREKVVGKYSSVLAEMGYDILSVNAYAKIAQTAAGKGSNAEKWAYVIENVPAKDQANVLKTFMSEENAATLDKFVSSGLTAKDFADVFAAAGKSPTNLDKWNAVVKTFKNERDRMKAFEAIMTEKNFKGLTGVVDSGITTEEFIDYYNKHQEINDMDGLSASQKREQFAVWLDQETDLTQEQRNAVLNGFSYSSGFTTAETKYEKLTNLGLSSDAAAKVTEAFGNIVPEDGKESASNAQKIEAAIGLNLSAADLDLTMSNILGSEEKTEKGDLTAYGKYKYLSARGIAKSVYLDLYKNGNVDKYVSYLQKGTDPAVALSLVNTFDSIEPEAGKSSVSDNQKLAAVSGYSTAARNQAVGTILGSEMKTASGGDSQYAQYLKAMDAGLSYDRWLDLKESGKVDSFLKYYDYKVGISAESAAKFAETRKAYDTDDNGSYTLAEDEAWIRAQKWSNTTASKMWTALHPTSKNNPFNGGDTYIGKTTDSGKKKTVEDVLKENGKAKDYKDVLTEKQYSHLAAGTDNGFFSASQYATVFSKKKDYISSGEGSATSMSNAEWGNAISAIYPKATDVEKAALWQALTQSTSTKNNPFATSESAKAAAQKIIDENKKATAWLDDDGLPKPLIIGAM